VVYRLPMVVVKLLLLLVVLVSMVLVSMVIVKDFRHSLPPGLVVVVKRLYRAWLFFSVIYDGQQIWMKLYKQNEMYL